MRFTLVTLALWLALQGSAMWLALTGRVVLGAFAEGGAMLDAGALWLYGARQGRTRDR